MARSVLQFILVATIVVAVLLTALWAFQRRLIYFPSTASVPSAASVIDGGQDITLHTSDGLDLGAWLIPPKGRHDHDLTVLVANGNAGDRAGRAPLATALAERGFAVLLFDYRGYAGNPGSPSEEGLALDVRAAYDYLVDEAAIPANELIYLGESLGAAVVTELATDRPPAAVVLRSPFVDLAAVGHDHYPWLPVRTLLKDEFPVAGLITSVEVPVAVVYGSNDSVVDPGQSRAVAAAAPQLSALVEVPGADHNDEELAHGDAVVQVMVDLADDIARQQP